MFHTVWVWCVVACAVTRPALGAPSPAPAAMFQPATSSQSIVFHQPRHIQQQPAFISPKDGDDSHPKYEYKYEVSDHQTGDRKSHWESRDGDLVRGVYTLLEPDGALRKVEYTADSRHGFNAVVTRNGKVKHPPPSPILSSNTISPGYGDSSFVSPSQGYPPSKHSGLRGQAIDDPAIGQQAAVHQSIPDIGSEYNVNHSPGEGRNINY